MIKGRSHGDSPRDYSYIYCYVTVVMAAELTHVIVCRCVIWTWFWCCTAVIASLGGRKGTKEPQRDGECYFFLLFRLRGRGRRNGVWPVSTFIWLRHYLYCGCGLCYDSIYLLYIFSSNGKKKDETD